MQIVPLGIHFSISALKFRCCEFNAEELLFLSAKRGQRLLGALAPTLRGAAIGSEHGG